jgi:L-fuconolactonase
MSKIKEGRDEPIIDPEIPIIDSHQHLFVRPNLNYLFHDYLEDVYAGHNVVASVYIETLFMARSKGPEILRPIGEIEFANGMGAMSDSGQYGKCRVAAAIVGHANLDAGDEVAILLDKAMSLAPDRLRGFRQIAMSHSDPSALRFLGTKPNKDFLKSASFLQGLRQLAQRGLSFDATVFHHQMSELAAIAAAIPNLKIVLNHLGLALAMDVPVSERQEVFNAWRKALKDLAKQPNVFCKVGGLGTAYWGFDFSTRATPTGYLELAKAWQPFIETAIEAFGVHRCMMESDYPADARSCGFVPLWNALKHSVRGCTTEEKQALFFGTAAQFYRIEC